MTFYKKGFTIVELLVVIVVIAILAAITIVTYNGITKQAVETSMKSDLEAARNSIAIMKAGKKNYPLSAAAANNGEGLKASGENILNYSSAGTSYTVVATNKATNKRFCLVKGTISECNGAFIGTLAGNPADTYPSNDGQGENGSFDYPSGLTFDANGDLIVGDCGRAVRKVTPSGTVSTIGGILNNSGYLDGQVDTALIGCVTGVEVSQDGAVYFSESYSFYGLRKIANGNITTVAGNTASGSADGTGTAAQFSDPMGTAIDANGNIFISECGAQHAIRRVTPAGVVTTVAGGAEGFSDGTGTAAQFSCPHDMVFDKNGDLIIADSGNRRIRKMTPAGAVTTLAGSGIDDRIDATGTAAAFGYPTSVAVDKDNNYYVTDNTPYSIRKITSAGVVTTVIGGNTSGGYIDGIGSDVQLGWMDNGIAIDDNGIIYIADSNSRVIRKIIQ